MKIKYTVKPQKFINGVRIGAQLEYHGNTWERKEQQWFCIGPTSSVHYQTYSHGDPNNVDKEFLTGTGYKIVKL